MADFDFSNLQIDQATAWMEVPDISPEARILMAPATESNKPYYNEMLRLSGGRIRKIQRTDKIDPKDAKKNREEDLELYPKHVFKGWEGVTDRSGKQIAFSVEEACDLCRKIPTWLFDRIRNFAAAPENFIRDREPTPDPAGLVGN